MKILVVDDDPIQRSVIAATLQARGDTVMTADSGESAVEMVTSGLHHFDTVLMDQQMPGGMSGAEAARRIRTLPDWRGQVTILAISAGDPPADNKLSDGFLSKDPGSLGGLREAMVDASAAGQARAIAEQQPPRSTLVNWMKINLVFLIGLAISFLLATVGGIWATGVWFSDLKHDNAEVRAVNAAQDRRLDDSHNAVVDIDRRLNEMTGRLADARRDAETNLANARRETDQSLAAEREGLAVLQAQLRFLGDRTPVAPIGGRR
jgi:CheY-like chemotaxis protein